MISTFLLIRLNLSLFTIKAAPGMINNRARIKKGKMLWCKIEREREMRGREETNVSFKHQEMIEVGCNPEMRIIVFLCKPVCSL